MCNFSGKLIAWLDHELPENEATDVERHVKGCAECRSSVHAYGEAGNLFDAYCEAVVASRVDRKHSLWTPVFAGAAVAVVGLVLVFLPVLSKQSAPIDQLPLHSAAVVPPPVGVVKVGVSLVKGSRRQNVTRVNNSARAAARNLVQDSLQNEEANWMGTGSAIQIAIPGDAVFPPGVVPEGVNFIADLSIAADGSAERLHLRP